jgi:hypothetical protein
MPTTSSLPLVCLPRLGPALAFVSDLRCRSGLALGR